MRKPNWKLNWNDPHLNIELNISWDSILEAKKIHMKPSFDLIWKEFVHMEMESISSSKTKYLKWITFAINCFICDEPNSEFVSEMGEICNIIMILASYHIILSIQHLYSAYPSTFLHPCHVHEAKCIQIECHVNASVNCGTVQNVNKVSIDVIPRWITCTSQLCDRIVACFQTLVLYSMYESTFFGCWDNIIIQLKDQIWLRLDVYVCMLDFR